MASKHGVKLFEIVKKLPGFGIGRTVTRTTWPPDSYWRILDVQPKVDGMSGKIWGYKVWKGEKQTSDHCRVFGAAKKVWTLLPKDHHAAQDQDKS